MINAFNLVHLIRNCQLKEHLTPPTLLSLNSLRIKCFHTGRKLKKGYLVKLQQLLIVAVGGKIRCDVLHIMVAVDALRKHGPCFLFCGNY